MNYLYLPIETMPFGKERRALIMKAFDSSEDSRYCVNHLHRPQLKDDPDLRKLIRDGKLRRLRVGSRTNRHTYLMLA